MTQQEIDAFRIACMCWTANDILSRIDLNSAGPGCLSSIADTLTHLADIQLKSMKFFGSIVWNIALEKAHRQKGALHA